MSGQYHQPVIGGMKYADKRTANSPVPMEVTADFMLSKAGASKRSIVLLTTGFLLDNSSRRSCADELVGRMNISYRVPEYERIRGSVEKK